MYRLYIYTTSGDSSAVTSLSTGEMTLKGWSKRINDAGKMVFSMHKANVKATDTNLRQYRRVRLYRKKRDGSGTYAQVWFGYIEATKQLDNEIEVLCVGMLDLFRKRYTNGQRNGAGSAEAFDILADTNSTDGETGIVSGTGGVVSTKDLTFTNKEILGAWDDLAKAHDAEFEIDDDGELNFVSALGTDKSATVTLTFRQDGEPGTNCNELELGEDGKDMANRVIGISGTMTSTQNDAASQTIYGMLVERKMFNEANDQTTLDAMTSAYLSERANPITDFSVEPTLATKKVSAVSGSRVVSGLQYEDVSIGDLVTVVVVTPSRTINATRRIAELEVDVDENNDEKLKFTLAGSGVHITSSGISSREFVDVQRKIRELEYAVTHPSQLSVGGGITGGKTTNFFAWSNAQGDAGIFQGNQPSTETYPYVETWVQNLASTGTSDICAGPDTEIVVPASDRYIDLGINGSQYDGNDMGWGYTLPNDGYLFVASLGTGGNLALGVTGATTKLQLFAGGQAGSDVKLTVSADGVQFGFLDENTTGGPFTYTTPILDMAATPKKTIDPSARKLYFPDGTTAAIDYSVQGTVTITGLSVTLADNSVTYAKIQDVSATSRIMGRITAGAGDMEELTAANVKTILALTSSDVGLGSVENTALSIWAGTANITTLGTITTGVWNAGVVTSSGLITGTGFKGASLYPAADSTTAVQIRKADGTTNVLNVDTTNSRVGIGTTGPTAVLHLKAGTATASTAPLKFTSGTVLGTTEAGAIEFDGTHLYFTAANAGTRYQLDQQGGTISGLSANGAVYATAADAIASTAALTDGQLLVGKTGLAPVAATLTGTANQITVTNGAGTITLSTPQSIATASTPQFARLGLGQAADAGAVMAATGQYFSAKKTDTVADSTWTSDWNEGNVHYIVLGNGAHTAPTLSNPKDGSRYLLILKQPAADAAGTVTWPAAMLWSGGTAPTLTATNAKVDIITLVYDATNSKYYCGSTLNY